MHITKLGQNISTDITLVNTMVGVTARLVYVAVKDHDLDDHVTEGE